MVSKVSMTRIAVGMLVVSTDAIFVTGVAL